MVATSDFQTHHIVINMCELFSVRLGVTTPRHGGRRRRHEHEVRSRELEREISARGLKQARSASSPPVDVRSRYPFSRGRLANDRRPAGPMAGPSTPCPTDHAAPAG